MFHVRSDSDSSVSNARAYLERTDDDDEARAGVEAHRLTETSSPRVRSTSSLSSPRGDGRRDFTREERRVSVTRRTKISSFDRRTVRHKSLLSLELHSRALATGSTSPRVDRFSFLASPFKPPIEHPKRYVSSSIVVSRLRSSPEKTRVHATRDPLTTRESSRVHFGEIARKIRSFRP